MNLKPAFKSYPPLPALRVCVVAWVGCTTSVSRREQSSRAGRAGRKLSGSRHRLYYPRLPGALLPHQAPAQICLPWPDPYPYLTYCSPPFHIPRERRALPRRFPEGWTCLALGTRPEDGCRMCLQQERRCAWCRSHAWWFPSHPFLH